MTPSVVWVKITPPSVKTPFYIWLRNSGLSLSLAVIFLLFLVGHAIAGWEFENDKNQDLGRPHIQLSEYVFSGGFLQSVMENWESEFLQMMAYIWMTVVLYQKGSSESKDPEARDEDEVDAAHPVPATAPWPVRRGGWMRKFYEHSLALAFLGLFLLSLALHALGGSIDYNQEAALHGRNPVTLLGYMGTSRFWFESMQNWQSEFLSILCIVILSIWLRQKGSPESKHLYAPHSSTGR